MNGYSTYRSAIHCVMMALQAQGRYEHAYSFSEAMWDVGPEDGSCDAYLLSSLLAKVNIESTFGTATRPQLEKIASDMYAEHRITFQQIHYGPGKGLTRWGAIYAARRGELYSAFAVDPSDPPMPRGHSVRMATGEYVILTHAIRWPSPIVAEPDPRADLPPGFLSITLLDEEGN